MITHSNIQEEGDTISIATMKPSAGLLINQLQSYKKTIALFHSIMLYYTIFTRHLLKTYEKYNFVCMVHYTMFNK